MRYLVGLLAASVSFLVVACGDVAPSSEGGDWGGDDDWASGVRKKADSGTADSATTGGDQGSGSTGGGTGGTGTEADAGGASSGDGGTWTSGDAGSPPPATTATATVKVD